MQTDLYPQSILKTKSNRMAYVGSINAPEPDIDRNEWYTPEIYIRAATEVMGAIDLDPYSDAKANEIVKAKQLLTKHDNPIQTYRWPSAKTVWMNPPYGRGLIDLCIDKFCRELHWQNFEAIVLTNNATETQWFQQLLRCSSSVCLTNHRIEFVDATGKKIKYRKSDGKKVSGNTRGQTFFHFVNHSSDECNRYQKDRFRYFFREFGSILTH